MKTTSISIKNKTKKTPSLRFKEFSGEWQEKKLTNLLSKIIDNRGKTPPVTTVGLPLIETNALGSKEVRYTVIKKFVDEDTYSNWFRQHIQKDDTLFSTVGQTAVCSLYDGSKATIAQNIVGLRAATNVDPNFLYYLLVEPINNHQFKKIEMIAVQPSVKVSQMIHLKFTLPQKEEQQKIAEFLTSVDERIELQDKKVKLLEKYKKGIMQKIFSQVVRFKDVNGRNYSDWQEKKLGELGEFKTSSVDKLIRKGEKKVYLVNYMNVYRHEEISLRTHQSLNEVTANNTQIHTSNLKSGDILFTPSSEIPSDIGHSVVITEDLPNTLFSYHLVRFRPKVNIDVSFSHFFCNIPYILKQIARRSQGSTRFTITVGEFSKVIVNLPTSISEQQKIADFLTSIDSKLELEKNKLNQVKQFKKALLQRMFV